MITHLEKLLLPPETLLGRGAADYYGRGFGEVQEIKLGNNLYMCRDTLHSADPAGWNTIVASVNQDVTNAQNENHNEFRFPVAAGSTYGVELWLYYGTSSTAGDFEFRFLVTAGTMTGNGQVVSDNLANGISTQRIVVTIGNTSNIALGAVADASVPYVARCNFSFKQNTATGMFKFQFGNNTPGVGNVSRVMRGSILRWKQLT